MQAIPVFYTPKMVAKDASRMSPSAAKPAHVVASWSRLRGVQIQVREPIPVTFGELALAHDPAFVRDVLALRQPNGFGNRSLEVAESLPYTSGAMLSAAYEALRSGSVAVAPCSGFHHASYRRAGGFCTFNGLMVAALTLLKAGTVSRVGIIDCDMHYGDGTDAIIQASGELGEHVVHFTAGKSFHRPSDAPEFFAALAKAVRGMRGCDVVLYQAGADPHVNDPLGGFLTTEQLRERDALVFDLLRSFKVPVAWNLAGGYQVEANGSIPKVLEIHDNTMRECARVFGDL